MPEIARCAYLSNDKELPETWTDKCHTELFSRQELVYLSPDSRNELVYNADDVYVIGGLVDLTFIKNASLGKAKSQKIRHAKLPLERILG